MNLRDYSSVSARRKALELTTKTQLNNIGKFTFNEAVASSRHCENMIGGTQVPLGVAGPLRVKSLNFAARDYFVPLSTTEGALVASVSRGCKAITQCDGTTVDSYRVGATRGPAFKVKNLKESDKLNKFLDKRFSDIQSIAAKTSGHLQLKKYMDRGVGRYRYIRFVFDTQDAMGMNMVTIATEAVVNFIEQETKIRCVSLAGNYDVDKKPSWLNVIEGRGFKVWAEVVLSEAVLKQTLKTSSEKMYETWFAKCMLGSAMSGSMGFNAHYANIVAALFLATGQDLAHVSEGSLGVTTTEIISKKDGKNSLYVSVYLPDLLVGTVGGGTELATQREALELLGVVKEESGYGAIKLAEIVGATVLAGEISLLASLTQGNLAHAHQRLGRGVK